ncbi:hypothetical protein BMW22_27395 (plasmid) [Rhizobium leguminosarum]|uniref:Uncharacterized protein n=1 Tax=Rhizobium leguminosarum TaxID=384 RepID=A0A1L3ZHZ0_RHILE|nr:hypothetical protein BMW22_27395 [Rhizobium leguminosarum]
MHFKQFELFPFAMWQAFPAADYYENSANMMDIRVNSLATQYLRCHSIMPSLVHMLDVSVLVRLPVAVFSLAFRKSMPMSWSGCILPWLLRTTYISVRIRMTLAYVSSVIISIPPVKPCRRRRPFSPQMRVNRFVFLNLPILQPREPSWRNGFASIPFTCGLRHPAS